MEPLSERCYPSNFFDPFGDEPTHSPCAECGEIFDNGDLTKVGAHFYARYLCDDCLDKEPKEDEEDLT